jgi:hypothetical protein
MFTGMVDIVARKELVFDDETLGAKWVEGPVPDGPAGEGRGAAPRAAGGGGRVRRRADGEVPGGRRADGRGVPAPIRKATIANAVVPGAVRLGVQEQGRAAAAGRGGGLPAVARGRDGDPGPPAAPRRDVRDARAERRPAVRGAGVQDRHGPVRGEADVLPGLLGVAARGLVRVQLHAGQPRAGGASAPDAREPSRGARRRCSPATSRRPSV